MSPKDRSILLITTGISPGDNEGGEPVNCEIRVNLLYIFTLCRYGNSALGLLGNVRDRLSLGSPILIRGYVINLDRFGNDLSGILSGFLDDFFLNLNGDTDVTDRFNFVTVLVLEMNIKSDHSVILFATVCQGAFRILVCSVVLGKNGCDQANRNVKCVAACFGGHHESGDFRAVGHKFLFSLGCRFFCRLFRYLGALLLSARFILCGY